jgi:hypothetical protein
MVFAHFMTDEQVELVAGQLTNSLRASFLGAENIGVSVKQAYQELAPFGDILRLEVPPGAPWTAVVSFYDVRAAANALATLGRDRCAWEPQCGNRTVCLPGDVQLSASMVDKIETVRLSDNGTYSIDFFDTRAADKIDEKREQGELREQGALLQAPPGLELPSGEPAPAAAEIPAPAPRYRNDLRLSQVNWTDLANGREWRTTLRLRCLPGKLCDKDTFKRLLALAGLTEMVDCLRVFPSEGNKRTGSALVNAVSSAGVTAVARYFHGRQWGNSMPCAVSFAAVQGAAEVRKAFLEAKRKFSPCGQAKVLGKAAQQVATAKAEPCWVETTCISACDSIGKALPHPEAARLPMPVFVVA